MTTHYTTISRAGHVKWKSLLDTPESIVTSTPLKIESYETIRYSSSLPPTNVFSPKQSGVKSESSADNKDRRIQGIPQEARQSGEICLGQLCRNSSWGPVESQGHKVGFVENLV